MNFNHFLAEYRIWFGVLASVAFVNGFLAHRELLKLYAQRQDLLRSVGIIRVDWWFRCIWGAMQLGFGQAGKSLPWFSRLVFKGIGFHYAWLLLLALLMALGVLKI
ncbi:hypothetical protein [Pseudoxanthomonas dokdonensis]|uniref:hypothetical protein n=1 Tax=Pseudoxanthomonas dokdonensis TaxID=344882 RepID=UPI0012EDDBFD|nr:hypothetical protein [Pseudoxanthomonas dokdonensis]